MTGRPCTWNNFKTVAGFVGERLVATIVFETDKEGARGGKWYPWLFIFDSGYALQINPNRTFGALRPIDAMQIMRRELARREVGVSSVDTIKEAMELLTNVA